MINNDALVTLTVSFNEKNFPILKLSIYHFDCLAHPLLQLCLCHWTSNTWQPKFFGHAIRHSCTWPGRLILCCYFLFIMFFVLSFIHALSRGLYIKLSTIVQLKHTTVIASFLLNALIYLAWIVVSFQLWGSSGAFRTLIILLSHNCEGIHIEYNNYNYHISLMSGPRPMHAGLYIGLNSVPALGKYSMREYLFK